ncbi:MAG: hypothetical protein KDD02_15030 [Phaeodactylibacter sp.]|nr:hypothetical protein [Phaeodactylibacter sp.]MCB9302586.1 hypothetical protein [Lewinellaceae bacterium]
MSFLPLPDGGSSKKPDEGTKVADPRKSAVFVYPDPHLEEEPQLKKAKSFEDALRVLRIMEEVEFEGLDGTTQSATLAVTDKSSLLSKGINEQVPELDLQKKLIDLLHRLHQNLNDSPRVQHFFDQFFEEEEIEGLVEKLEKASTSLLEYHSENQKIK